MSRIVLMGYGIAAYILFNVVFLYLVGFLLNLTVPKGINDDTLAPIGETLAVNIGVIFLFGFTHSFMARESFKKRWTRIIPAVAERSTYVVQASLFLALAMWQWRPMPEVIWSLDGVAAAMMYVLFLTGVAIVLVSTFLIDHFELFGLRQVCTAYCDAPMPKAEFRTPMLYKIVRHPMQLGVVFVVLATPHMTVGHMLFALSMIAYIIIGLYFEERSLVRQFGDVYRDYQSSVPMLVPMPRQWRRPASQTRSAPRA